MEWDKKVELITLHNNGKEKEMLEFIKENIKLFDEPQAVDMVMNCITLTEETFKENSELYKTLYDQIKNIEQPGLRGALRVALLGTLIEKTQK